MSTAKKSIKGVTVYDPAKTDDGYTLVAPQGGYNVWLINMKGEVVYNWPLERQPCFYALLLQNGHLLYQGREEKDIQGPVVDIRDSTGEIIANLVMGGGRVPDRVG